jgi:hypothetical protein
MNTSVTLLSGLVEAPVIGEPGEVFSVTEINLSGEPYANAIVLAVAADYHRVTKRARPTPEDLLELVGSEVTLAVHSSGLFGLQVLEAVEGVLILRKNPRYGLLAEDSLTRGLPFDVERVLDVEPGYDNARAMGRRVDEVRASLPDVGPLTDERLLELPERAADPEQIGLAVFASECGDGNIGTGAIWLLHSYQPDDDIATGYVILRGEDGVSRTESVRGTNLLARGGEILDPPQLSLADAIGLGALPYHEALAQFVTPQMFE